MTLKIAEAILKIDFDTEIHYQSSISVEARMIRNIETDELKDMMDTGQEFVLVNVLERDSFENERICGSINIPLQNIEDAANLISKDETIVVHCSGPACKASSTAADRLENLGFKDIRKYEGGIEDWKNSGFCLEGNLYRRFAA